MLKRLLTLCPAIPLCACLIGLMVSHRAGAIAYIAAAALTPLLACNAQVAKALDRHPRLSLVVAIVGWAFAVFRIGWFWGRCAL